MNKYDAKLIALVKKQRLQKMLSNSEFKYRKLPTLAAAIGESESETTEILRSIGASQSRGRRGSVLFRLPG